MNDKNYFFWPQSDGTLNKYPFYTDEKTLWEIIPSGNDDNKYWLVYTLLDTNDNTWKSYFFWPQSDGTLNRYPFYKDEKTLWEIIPSGNDDNKYWLIYPLPDTTGNANDNTDYGKIKSHHVYPQTDGTLGRWPFWKESGRLWEIVPKSGIPSLGKTDVEGYTMREYYQA
jgi:hypothetical protein